MRKALLGKLAILFLLFSIMSGCIWAIEDDGYRGSGSHERDRGGHRGEDHDHR
jgi:hypothetical protein